MRRMIISVALLVGVLTLVASGLADAGRQGQGEGSGEEQVQLHAHDYGPSL